MKKFEIPPTRSRSKPATDPALWGEPRHDARGGCSCDGSAGKKVADASDFSRPLFGQACGASGAVVGRLFGEPPDLSMSELTAISLIPSGPIPVYRPPVQGNGAEARVAPLYYASSHR